MARTAPLDADDARTAALPAPRQRHPRRRRVIRVALYLLLAFALLAGIGSGYSYYRLTATLTTYPSAHFNRNQNALWLEHEWSGEYHTPAEYDALAAQLQRERIAYVFAHVGPLSSDGTIPENLALWAPDLAQALHTRLPGVKVLAWVGQLEAASGAPANEVVNLADAATRLTIAATAARFVTLDHLDGIHYDIEPISNNNAHFLDLLIETRALLPSGSIISVAAHVGQIAVMSYDSGMPTARAYEIFMQQETKHILAALDTAQRPPQLLMGVPTYSGDSLWFHASAENMTTALAGVTAGLNSANETDAFAGVAIYRLAVTSDSDWQVYDHTWLGER